jgi:hypothetical protein
MSKWSPSVWRCGGDFSRSCGLMSVPVICGDGGTGLPDGICALTLWMWCENVTFLCEEIRRDARRFGC